MIFGIINTIFLIVDLVVFPYLWRLELLKLDSIPYEASYSSAYRTAYETFENNSARLNLINILFILSVFVIWLIYLHKNKQNINYKGFLLIVLLYLYYSVSLMTQTFVDGWTAMYLGFLYLGFFSALFVTTLIILTRTYLKKISFNFKFKSTLLFMGVFLAQLVTMALNPSDCGDAPGSFNFIQTLYIDIRCGSGGTNITPMVSSSMDMIVILTYLALTAILWIKGLFFDIRNKI